MSRFGSHVSPLVTTSDAASQKMTILNAFVLQSITELTMSCLLVTMVVTVVRYDGIISNKARITHVWISCHIHSLFPPGKAIHYG